MKKISIKIKAEDLRKKLQIRNGVDGKSIKGDPGKDGKSPDASTIAEVATQRVLGEVIPLIPTISAITNQLPVLGHIFRDGLELLSGEDRLDSSAIKGLPEWKDNITNITSGYGGLNLYVKGAKIGATKTIDFLGMTYSKVNGRETLTPDAVSENYLTKITAVDTTANYLVSKVLAGTGVTVTKENAGGNEDLKIALDKTYTDGLYYPLSTNPAGYLTAESDPLSWLKATAQTGLTGDKTGTFNLTTTGTLGAGATTVTKLITSQTKTVTIQAPNDVYTVNNLIPITVSTLYALTVTGVKVSCNNDPATEITGDLKYADAMIGLANSTLINAIDTTAGVYSSGAISVAVAQGKFIYIVFDAAPSVLISNITVEITFTF